MTRSVGDKDQFTPFGLWIREYLKDSREGLCVTNLDYVFEDFKRKKIMLLEEKQSGGRIGNGQMLTFDVLDYCLSVVAPRKGYEYWGFFILQFPRGATMPGPGMTLNGYKVTCEELQKHLNFESRFCDGLDLPWKKKSAA